MKKKFLVIGATVVLALSTLTGCGSKESTGDATSEEATVTDVAETTEETTVEEVTTEEYDLDAYNSSFSFSSGGGEFLAYKEGDEFVCGEYIFEPGSSKSYYTYTASDSTTLNLFTVRTSDANFFEGFDAFEDSSTSESYVRTGDICEFTNADGNKVKMYSADCTDVANGGVVYKIVTIAIDNGITMMLSSRDIEIAQDEFEKFLPLTEGWITNQ